MKAYDWSGLRHWRILFALSLLAFLPVSCFATSAASAFRFPATIGVSVGLLLVMGTLYRLRTWPCPRCSSNFSAKDAWPWVSPWRAACSSCGLPDFTSTEEEAPPIVVTHAPSQPSPALSLQDDALRRAAKKRTRVALIFAIPLIYLSMCRLPSGEQVRTLSGRQIQVIGVMRSKFWMSGQGTMESVEIAYYSLSPGNRTELRDVLTIVMPMTAPTDSIIQVSQVNGSWWLRTLGIRVTHEYFFRRRADGTWNEDF